MRKLHNTKDLKALRKQLRNELTPAEAALWRSLQGSRLQGRKFRRQHSIGPYVADFYCPGEKLVVELDGAAHDTSTSFLHDERRAAYLRSLGIEVLRIENREVFQNLDGVLALIAQQFKLRT